LPAGDQLFFLTFIESLDAKLRLRRAAAVTKAFRKLQFQGSFTAQVLRTAITARVFEQAPLNVGGNTGIQAAVRSFR
jgi:hypothetical protein